MSGVKNNGTSFTYDFGIAISQSTIGKLVKLTGASLSLASAFYTLRNTAVQYVDTLRKNTLRFGGVLSTMKAMEQAQNRLIAGQSHFSVDDQLQGMNQLMSVGVDVGRNLDWINKAAHATGKSFAEFSGMITNAINGNLQGLVDAGLMTQRTTKMFEKFQGNQIMMQKAVMSFLKQHKGLINAINNDFLTVEDGVKRLKAVFSSFLKSVIGKPNDPGSLYGTISRMINDFADAFGKGGKMSKSMQALQEYGKGIGMLLTWVVKQVGGVIRYLLRQAKNMASALLGSSDTFAERMRSFIVWLEFWKQEVVSFLKEYENEIKFLLKLLIAYKALKFVFTIGKSALNSVILYRDAIKGTIALQKRYMASMGPFIGKYAKFFQSLAVWLPKPLRKAWVYLGKFFADFSINMGLIGKKIVSVFAGPFKWLWNGFKFLIGLIRNLPGLIASIFKGLKALWTAINATNPIGWIILAITLLTTLYAKSEKFRVFVNNLFKGIWEAIKFIWNIIALVLTVVQIGLKNVWTSFKTNVWDNIKNFFDNAMTWISEMWNAFKDTTIGKWINEHIVQPLETVFNWIGNVWSVISNSIGKVVSWISGANNELSQTTDELAAKNGVIAVPTLKGGNYDTNDSTSYLNPNNWWDASKQNAPTIENTNPILGNSVASSNSNSDRNSTNMSFNNGAIKIVVQKGENIDENKLAEQVKRVILDMKREGELRG